VQVEEIVAQAKDSIGAKAVFGAPYEKNGLTIIPAAQFMGGAGGGEGQAPAAGETEASVQTAMTGSGGGYGVSGKPTGAFVIKGDKVSWVPAVDVNRLMLGFQIVMVVFFLAIRSIAKSRSSGFAR
jgi:uncharacterized spore protein YtfJ